MAKSFSVSYRNPGHWDVSVDGTRKFTLRGEPGDVIVNTDRASDPYRNLNPGHYNHPRFRTISAAMAYLLDELMWDEQQTGYVG